MTAGTPAKGGTHVLSAQARDAASLLVRRSRRGVRVDERTLLNHPEFDGGAFVRVFVEDTSVVEPGAESGAAPAAANRRLPERDLPRVRRRVSALRGTRSTRSTPCSARSIASGTASRPRPTSMRSESARGPTTERRRDALSEEASNTAGRPVGRAPGFDAGAEQRRRLRLGRRRLDATACDSSSSVPRAAATTRTSGS